MVNVSVIIPCFNSEKTIQETIESVLAQTYQDFEIIVVDDGSTDGSRNIVQSNGKKVIYIYQDNAGQSAARNTAIRNASGKYLAFLDADDLWLPEKLGKQLEKMQKTGIDWCYCDCDYFQDETGKVIGKFSKLVRPPRIGWVARDLFMGNFIASPTPIVSRTIFDRAGFFDESTEIRSREDWDEWVRIAIFSEIVYLPESLTRYRIHKQSITHLENPENAYNSHIAVVNKLCKQYPDIVGDLREEAYSNYAMTFSKINYFQRNYSAARRLIKIANNVNPKFYFQWLHMQYSLPAPVNNMILRMREFFMGDL